MASRWAGISNRIRIAGPFYGFWRAGFGLAPLRPPGVASGQWVGIGPVWVRLGRRSSWQEQDLDAEMIKPVEP